MCGSIMVMQQAVNLQDVGSNPICTAWSMLVRLNGRAARVERVRTGSSPVQITYSISLCSSVSRAVG